ncbi:hypothetical protein QR674_08140 [Acinetobacter chinensis]|uniref:DUF4044 domain-containing protein n=1 Tax=Acinetobacter chinensis TaxID=2004650 RepID=A0ABU3WF62_9GAMM|nr:MULTISPECIES: hypothetical protein [Acinetobacter]MDV2468952.1 hypothetical protein [Acinetobacter chinensis]WOE43257.1 hypothetical protein QSG87_10075 [Acinetobacter chinensis]
MKFFKKKNKTSFVFFIMILYSFIGVGLGYLLTEYFM